MLHPRSTSILFALCLSATSLAHAQSYTIARVTPDKFVIARDLNDAGEVVGSTNPNVNNSGIRSLLWRNGQTIVIPPFAGALGSSEAIAINNRSEVIGVTNISPNGGSFQQRGFLWRQGVTINLGIRSPHQDASPEDINGSTRIVGWFGGGAGVPDLYSGTWLWQAGTMQDLPVFVPRLDPGVASARINDVGEVVAGHAITQAGVVTAFAPPPGNSTLMIGADLNNHAQVVGYAVLDSGRVQATWWQSGQTRLLPLRIAGTNTVARAINDSEVIAGYEVVVGDEEAGIPDVFTALVWLNGRAYCLRTLIQLGGPLRPHVRLERAIRVNKRGQILALGRDMRTPRDPSVPFILTPVP